MSNRNFPGAGGSGVVSWITTWLGFDLPADDLLKRVTEKTTVSNMLIPLRYSVKIL